MSRLDETLEGMRVLQTRVIELESMLRLLTGVLEDKIEGGPDHPWISGANFHDGQLVAALTAAKAALSRST